MPTIDKKKEIDKSFKVVSRNQKTISSSKSVSGIALFSGKKVTLSFVPAKPNSGIRFRRIDLPNKPYVFAMIDNLKSTFRTTTIGSDSISIQCVEHVLSALYAHNIDNIIIEIDHSEPPIIDGSSKVFYEMINEALVCTQEEKVDKYYLTKPIYLSESNSQIIALPSSRLRCSYLLSYENHPLLGACFYEFDANKDSYEKEVAPCRTFATLEEINTLIKLGAIKGVCNDYGLVIDGNSILNDEGLRFKNEMARHKVLDLLGDLSLVGKEVIAHYISIRAGHTLNTRLTKQLSTMIREQIDDSN